MPNYEALIKGISEFIGARGEAAEVRGTKKRGGTAHSPVDVERWLGALPVPDKQIPLIHDYLRGHSAMKEIVDTGLPEVQGIAAPVWESTQKVLQQQVDGDAAVQQALKDLYAGISTPRDPAVRTTPVIERIAPESAISIEGSLDTPVEPAKASKVRAPMTAEARKARRDAWDEVGRGIESQDIATLDAALERVKALHQNDKPPAPGESPAYQRALDYMAGLEQQAQQWRAAKLQAAEWEGALKMYRDHSGIDQVALPRDVSRAVDRMEAWAEGLKPPSAMDRVKEVLGSARTIQTSADFSAPGRQGLLMMSRPEYWQNLGHMIDARNPQAYMESQAYIRHHPHLEHAEKGGLALADVGSKLTHEEAFRQSDLVKKIPVIGDIIKSSERSYNTFLNRVRMDVFSNELRAAEAVGIDINNSKFLNDLAEWINTSTGRGGGKGFNPGILSDFLYSPRLAVSRLQTFNPQYYLKMHPAVARKAFQTNAMSAAAIFALVSLAGMFGAKVAWDFRNPDAGKVRVGNLRIDLGGGHFQVLRLLTQVIANEQVHPETGKVTELGKRFGSPTALDKVTQFIINKEAPIASFVTDMIRRKDVVGKEFNLPEAAIKRIVPLAMQDVYEVLKDKGLQSLLYSVPLATFGAGLQVYAPKAGAESVPFLGVKGEVPAEKQQEYARLIMEADIRATTQAALKSRGKSDAQAKSILRAYITAERLKVRREWIVANARAFGEARRAGTPSIKLQAPAEGGQ